MKSIFKKTWLFIIFQVITSTTINAVEIEVIPEDEWNDDVTAVVVYSPNHPVYKMHKPVNTAENQQNEEVNDDSSYGHKMWEYVKANPAKSTLVACALAFCGYCVYKKLQRQNKGQDEKYPNDKKLDENAEEASGEYLEIDGKTGVSV